MSAIPAPDLAALGALTSPNKEDTTMMVRLTLKDGRVGIIEDIIHMKVYFGMLFIAFRTEQGDNVSLICPMDLVLFMEVVQW